MSMSEHAHLPGLPPSEPESLAELRGDCARMASRWTEASGTSGAVEASGAAAPSAPPEPLHGVRVPPRSARLLEGMSEYGD